MRERSCAVARVGQRHERVEPVVAAVEVQRDEDRGVRASRRPAPLPPRARRASRDRGRRWLRAAGRRRLRAGRGARARRGARTPQARRARARGSARAGRRRRAARHACRASRCNHAASADLGVRAGEQHLAQHALALGPVVLDLPLLVPAGHAAPAVGRERRGRRLARPRLSGERIASRSSSLLGRPLLRESRRPRSRRAGARPPPGSACAASSSRATPRSAPSRSRSAGRTGAVPSDRASRPSRRCVMCVPVWRSMPAT